MAHTIVGIFAVACFLLAVCGVQSKIDLTGLGLVFLSLALLFV